MTKGQSIVGSSNKRSPADFYPTPEWATQLLLDNEKFEGDILEPACGDGAISEVLKQNNMGCLSTDLYDYGYGLDGVDFLERESHANYYNIITNPPFSKAKEFVLMAKIKSRIKIAMLLKLNFLEGISRYDMLQDKSFPLKCVYVFSRRVSFNKKKGGMIAYAWFVWDKQYKGEPVIKWIK